MAWQAIFVATSVLSLLAFVFTKTIIRGFIPIYFQRKLIGYDQCKVDKTPTPEPLGVIAAAVYLIFIFSFIPVLYNAWNDEQDVNYRMISVLAGIVSICTAILLGFADDVLDLRWRHKLIFPFISAWPLLLIYFIKGNSTAMHLPRFVQYWFNTTYVDFGLLYYVFIIMLIIFCTNAINIIAGINGVEVGQSLVIAISVAIYNIIQIVRLDSTHTWHNGLSLCFISPFIATSFALYSFNKYPAKVFVGDTYCYWAGMTLAVCAVTGHFSKTLLLFMIPQILNFIYSCPQLFHLIPCPRHRLPKFNPGTNKLENSMAEFVPDKLGTGGKICLKLLRLFKLIHYKEFEKDGEKWTQISNLTILNFMLLIFGPQHEWTLNTKFIIVQSTCSVIAFIIRFYIPIFLYEQVL